MTIRNLLVLLAAGLAFSTTSLAADRTTPVKVGESAPDFTLTDQNGQKHTLSAERGKRAVVLVFYRGYW